MPRRSGAPPGDGAAVPALVRFALVQALMHRGAMRESAALDVLEQLTGRRSVSELHGVIAEQNGAMDGLSLQVRVLRYPVDGHTYVGIANTVVDEPSKLASHYSPGQREFFKHALAAIAADAGADAGVGAASSAALLNLDLSRPHGDAGADGGDDAGSSAAAAAAAAAASTAAARKLTKTEKEAVLRQLADDGWLAVCPSRPGHYCIGVRSFMELGELLLSFELPETTREAWAEFLASLKAGAVRAVQPRAAVRPVAALSQRQQQAAKVAGAGLASLALVAGIAAAPAEAANVVHTVASAAEGYPFVPPSWAPAVFVPFTGLVLPAIVMSSLFVYIEAENPVRLPVMQALASRGLRVAPAAPAARRCGAVRPGVASSSSRRGGAARQLAAPLGAVAADITEFEEMALEGGAAAGGAAAPSGPVKLRVRMRGYDIGIMAKACEQIKLIAAMTGANIAGPVMLPTKKRVYCVLRSPHVNKDAREHFEIRIHNRLVDLTSLSAQTVQALMEWVPPSGLEVETSIV
ncbi:RPS10 [Scenedesmus sp. PABB004]|nr:RPS10 [Scenedesmus sp. PABB004]